MARLKEFASNLLNSVQALLADEAVLERAANVLAQAKEPVIAIGVGKSSFIARKFAASLQSISRSAHFLHPTEALHGDSGIVTGEQICVIISKSGNSAEINALLPLLQGRRTSIIAITNLSASPLARTAEIVLPLHISTEGDTHNLLPLVSCEVSLFICDYLVSRVADLRGFVPAVFAGNHPAGQIGLNLNRSLEDLPEWRQRRPYVTVESTLLEALVKISESHAGLCCVVGKDERLLGVVTDGDVRRAITRGIDIQQTSAGEIMNPRPLVVKVEATLNDILNLLEAGERKIAAAPVIDEQHRCQGVLLIHDLIRA